MPSFLMTNAYFLGQLRLAWNERCGNRAVGSNPSGTGCPLGIACIIYRGKLT